MKMERNQLSANFPDMSAEDFALLVVDIKTNGQQESGLTYQGKVLDGWHRYLACEQVGKAFRFNEYKGSDPVGLVLSKNLHRRHLTATQRAAVAGGCGGGCGGCGLPRCAVRCRWTAGRARSAGDGCGGGRLGPWRRRERVSSTLRERRRR